VCQYFGATAAALSNKTIFIMYCPLFALPLFLFLFACRSAPIPADINETVVRENTFPVQYSPSDLQKMHWLAGAWKSATIRQSFHFHGGNALEILLVDKTGDMSTCYFVWSDKRYYYGQSRQWSVTWIGEKDVRFEPVRPGLAPMTWTRLNAQKWHLVLHLPSGDEITVMERALETHP